MPPRMFNTEPVEKWHGGTTGPLRGAKATSYEGGHRVPAIIRWPGRIPAAQVIPELATTMDLHATILGLTATSAPEKPLDGRDIWPVLTEGVSSPHQYYYYFTGRKLDGIRDKTWKLRIAKPADGWTSPELQTGNEPVQLELFNLQNDPFEQFDMTVQNPEIVARLRDQMKEFAQQIGAELALKLKPVSIP